jgi:CubicO group peptidase (beta-lactamase class C family)
MRRTICVLASFAGLVSLGVAGLLLLRDPPDLQAQAHLSKAIDDVAKRTMKQWQTPGLALVVVHDDRVVYLKGLGVREVHKPDLVTADTVFPLASCSKSFTTLAMGMLVDEGKLDWDEPVRKHVPYFHLADKLADADVTLRDLVTHRTGVGSHDLLWYATPWTLEERIRRVGKLDLDMPFRAGFRYQVVLFGAAGVAVGNASKSSWQDFVQERILDPLKMKSSRCTQPPANEGNQASPHRKGEDGKVATTPRFAFTAPDPAGSIHSTARDLASYLRFQLGEGKWNGKQLISAESLAEPQTAQVVLRRAGAAKLMNPETQFLHYGMGWIVQDYRGKRVLMHGGSIDGFRIHLTLVPEARLGIALLNNLDGGFANLALSNSVLDLFLGAPAKDWSTYYLEVFEAGEREDRARAKELRNQRGAKGPPRALQDYVAVYEDAAYGSCKIELDKNGLIWNWEKLRAPLEYFQGDVFLANYGPLVDTAFIFTASKDGTVESFRAMGRVFRRK